MLATRQAEMCLHEAYYKVKAVIDEVTRLLDQAEVYQAIIMFEHTSSHMHQHN